MDFSHNPTHPDRFITPTVGKHLRDFLGGFLEYDEHNNQGVKEEELHVNQSEIGCAGSTK